MINELIEMLKTYTDGKDNTDKVEISVMQLNRIIKALDKEPTDAVDRVTIKEYMDSFGKDTNEKEPCEDAISKQAVIDTLTKTGGIRGDALKALYDLPPVIPQQKMGKWSRVTDKTGHLVWECDKCGWQQRFYTNFCPDCGSRKP